MALLALVQAARAAKRLNAVATALLAVPEPERLARDDAWAVPPAHWHQARQLSHVLTSLGIAVVPVWAYPPRLRCVFPLPPCLFVRGCPEVLGRAAVSIVGAREASSEALSWARRCARDASGEGMVVVSGGARGVDAAAHLGALEARGPTVAYLGVAADRIYPREHRQLFERIVSRGGALVSEHAPTWRTYASHHAARNRLIAAHADRVFIGEAGLRSGSLSTAYWARRLGVEVQISPPHVGGQRAGLEVLLSRGWARIARSDCTQT